MKHHQLRKNLAAAYQLVALAQADDLTFAHLSARLPDNNQFFIQPFGLLFEEVTASSLLTVNFEGKVLDGDEYQYNQTGYVIHSTIYKHKPEINVVFHLHTEATIAVSAMEQGLLPISQWALHFYNRVGYHKYNSLALSAESHECSLITDIGSNSILFMRNHGVLIFANTIHEAYIYMHHLERACKTQIMALSMNQPLILPDHATCEKSVKDLLGFEPDIGQRDWQALLRKLDRLQSNYGD